MKHRGARANVLSIPVTFGTVCLFRLSKLAIRFTKMWTWFVWLVSFASTVHFSALLIRLSDRYPITSVQCALGLTNYEESSISRPAMRPRSQSERRRNPRIATPNGLSASWKSGESDLTSAVGDFSVSGAFINSQQPVPVGTRLSLLFSLPEGEIQVQAIVRNSRPDGGIGVEFMSMGWKEFDLVLKTFRRLLEQPSPALLVGKN